MSDEHLPQKLADNLFKLEFLSLIRRNQKVCMYDYSLVDAKSLIGSIKRIIRNENRESNILEIKNIITETISLLTEYKESKYFTLIMEKLIKSKSGISSLLVTYHDDAKIICLINVILDELDIQIEKFSTS